MANSNNGGGAAPWLAFLVGALIVAIIGFFAFMQLNPQREQAELDIIAPMVETPSVAPLPAPPPDVNITIPAPQAAPAPVEPAPPPQSAPPETTPPSPY